MRLALTDYRVVLGGDLVGHGGWDERHRIGGPSPRHSDTGPGTGSARGNSDCGGLFFFAYERVIFGRLYWFEVLPILVEESCLYW